jgi:hypothetical protein
VRFEADYADRRNRLTVFLRLIPIVPIGIFAVGYSLVGAVAIVIAWCERSSRRTWRAAMPTSFC